jgi:hypothetical protein
MRAENHYFVTVDAESEVILEGVRAISAIRDEVQTRLNVKVPITWFVRFQRTWSESVNNDSPRYFQDRFKRGFDGFELAKQILSELRAQGDEIGWHYHAYNYVHRPDLTHALRIEILKADLLSCARELSARHPDFAIRTFRFGWFFVPDYEIFSTLKEIGIRADASVHPTRTGNVLNFKAKYLPPITDSIKNIDGLDVFPCSNTLLIHDWNVVPHQFDWASLDHAAAGHNRDDFKNALLAAAAALAGEQGDFLTYQIFPHREPRPSGQRN